MNNASTVTFLLSYITYDSQSFMFEYFKKVNKIKNVNIKSHCHNIITLSKIIVMFNIIATLRQKAQPTQYSEVCVQFHTLVSRVCICSK